MRCPRYSRKVRYASKKRVVRSIQRTEAHGWRQKGELKFYECPVCQGFHLTHLDGPRGAHAR